MRVFILQNGLTTKATHFYNESRTWLDCCAREGIPCRILAHRTASQEVIDDLDATACFPAAPDATFYVDTKGTKGRPQAPLETAFAETCHRAMGAEMRPGDIVIVPYARAPEIGGLARWLDRLEPQHRPFVVATMHRPEEEWEVDESRTKVHGNRDEISEAAQRMVSLATNGWLLLATNEPLAEIMSTALKLKVSVTAPFFSYALQERWLGEHGEATWPTFKDQTFDIGMLGQFRAEKGGTVAIEGLALALQARPGLEVLYHVRDQDTGRLLNAQMSRVKGTGRVNLLVGETSTEEFQMAVGACRLVLLPYNPARYRARISGPLVEAAAWGRPVVVPDDTWMADMVKAGNVAGRVFEAFDPDNIAAAIIVALDAREQLDTRAQSLAPAWRQERSIERALDLILDHVRGFRNAA
ncbi:MAG: glycosyltransferase [Rhodospirillaceae bacterium]|nr:glycosyltransferase [Rhodospirillaceae bacterium]MBT6204136.1 glycosyltransferase [Rhodospirillaceae bacterium]MBT6512645.1 glycosyltransferase [Rhodospirillaceae bacterium]MBT7647302.1 glycosyltransferase [Rhodospirillaceae bacterium]